MAEGFDEFQEEKAKKYLQCLEKEKPKNLSFFVACILVNNDVHKSNLSNQEQLSRLTKALGVVQGFQLYFFCFEYLKSHRYLSHKSNTYHSGRCHLPGILRTQCSESLTTLLDCAFCFLAGNIKMCFWRYIFSGKVFCVCFFSLSPWESFPQA